MHRLFGLLLVIYSLSQPSAFAQGCPQPTSVFSTGAKALTADNPGALLFIGNPAPSNTSIDVRSSGSVAVLSQDCYSLVAGSTGKLWFAVNNIGSGANSSVHLAIQILLIKASAATPAPPVIVALRSNNHTWFRGRTQAGAYLPEQKLIYTDLNGWNSVHNEYEALIQNDRVLRGPWHAAAASGGISSWDDEHPWWRVSPGTENQYDTVLDNRLLAFTVTKESSANGVPFYVSPKGALGFIIRYRSPSTEQQGSVRICLKQCDAILGVHTETTASGSFWSFLWHR